MQVENGSVVSFHYRLSNSAGSVVENSHGGDPTVYLHGASNILPKLEQAFAGKQTGDSFEVTLAPADAYGERQAAKIERVPAKYLKHEGKVRAGQVARIHLQDGGSMSVTVVMVGKFTVDVDSNHPLAGETLTFAVELVDVRAATDEEKAHGHAHGVGGHNH
jgi:FKBP-type peptidyl-prolyl cis-trans isomerase SlyD